MSSNDPSSGKKELESQATSPTPTATRPPPPSERRGPSMPPPPPRRSVKPSGPPPPPPRPPRGQRLAGVFSTPPPAPIPAAPPATTAAPTAPVASERPDPPPVAPVVEAPVVEAPVVESPVVESPVAEAVVESPVVESPIVESPIVESPVVESPVVEAPVVEAPVVEAPVEAPAELPLVEPAVAIAPLPAVVETSLPQELASSPQPPTLPVSAAPPTVAPEAPVALPTSVSLPPPPPATGSAGLRSQLAVAQARLISAVPPPWIAVARQHPVLWMAVAPITLASLFVLVLLAFEPPREPPPARADASPAAAAGAIPEPSPSPAPAPAVDKPAEASLAELESKPPGTLSVAELLRLNEGRAEHKRREVEALSQKLHGHADLGKDEALQAQLLRSAADPDTADAALSAMAQARSTVGPDLLYQVWTNPTIAAGTAELARSLLYSREVRPNASPALAAALQLRAADTCEAIKAALPQASSDADRRSLPALGKLNLRRGCGPKKNQDCYLCLRADMKQVVGAINAAKRRPAPAYSTR